MTRRAAALVAVLALACVAAPAHGAAASCPRLVDAPGDSSYGSLGPGSTDLDLREVHVASGARTLVVAVRLGSMAGTAPELRLGARVDARISLRPVDYFLSAQRDASGSWGFTMTSIRTEADGRPTTQPPRIIEGRVDPAAAEVVFVVSRSELAEPIDGKVIRLLGARTYLGGTVSVQESDRVDGVVLYRDRSRGCRSAG